MVGLVLNLFGKFYMKWLLVSSKMLLFVFCFEVYLVLLYMLSSKRMVLYCWEVYVGVIWVYGAKLVYGSISRLVNFVVMAIWLLCMLVLFMVFGVDLGGYVFWFCTMLVAMQFCCWIWLMMFLLFLVMWLFVMLKLEVL